MGSHRLDAAKLLLGLGLVMGLAGVAAHATCRWVAQALGSSTASYAAAVPVHTALAPSATAPPRASKATSPVPDRAGEKLVDLTREISAEGPRSYRLTRAALNALLGTLASVSRTPHVVNERGEELPLVLSLPEDSPWKRIGLRDGDVIEAINGLSLSSPSAALDVYVALREAPKYVVTLRRRGAKVNLTLTIVRRPL